MAMDRTRDFERLVTALDGASASTRVAPCHGVQSAFLVDAVELMQSLASLETLLEKTARAYVQPQLFLRLKTRERMTEQQKDEFDADVMELVRSCSARIDSLQDQSSRTPHITASQLEHEKEVVTYLLERLKALASASKRLQKRRHEIPFVRSHRLLPESERIALADKEDEILQAFAQKSKPKTAAKKPKDDTPQPSRAAEAPTAIAPSSTPFRGITRHDLPTDAPFFASQEETLEFTETQERHFRMENLSLQRHFQENLEDAKQMEAKMAEISSLMGQFADKIMEQQSEIELIHQHAQETKTNVKQSNKILEQTQQIGRGYGFMIFCIYLAFSLLLHALHYFNR
ncbi:hypothetical protein PINS_up008740 [Pythium insidiosum]|nr:hypothetical protein PINS_up008740 [Pythium insidiosum]